MYGSSFELYFDVAGVWYDLFVDSLSMFHVTDLSLIASISLQQVFSFLSTTFTWWFLLWKKLHEVCTLLLQRKLWNSILSTYSSAPNSSSNIKWDWKYNYYFIVDPNSLPSRNANLNSGMKYQLFIAQNICKVICSHFTFVLEFWVFFVCLVYWVLKQT